MSEQYQHLITGGEDPFLPALLDGINSAIQIHITVAFIRQSGFALIKEALKDALDRHARVRILTGDYLQITDPQALRSLLLLQEAGADVRIFECQGKQSFHMKAYIFIGKESGQQWGKAFVGSSNITQSALQDGLEWNLRVDWRENTIRFQEIIEKYDRLFNSAHALVLNHQWVDNYQLRVASQLEKAPVVPGADEILPPPTPYPVQQEALHALSDTRDKGYKRGLVVMATGLGKTWLAAFDSLQMNSKRVLFVAHREEILDQAEATFVRIRPDAKIGRYTGKKRELGVDMLFASVQTLGKARHLEQFAQDYFDYAIVDEFHHAAARTYRQLIHRFKPRFLLGLTATPDRTDQADILSLCDDNLVFSRDLYDGINARLLCPFHYYGFGDETVHYDEIPWRNGRFDPDRLVNQLATQARAKHALETWREHHQKRTLAFCVSHLHADFMAGYFSNRGIKSVSVHSESTVRRNQALRMLRSGEVEIIFSVDLFNEGIDVPAIDTVLMLRPTESKILFLQQLGRGLRQSPETQKEKLVVMDFIGNHISFFRKPEALFRIGITNQDRKGFLKKVQDGNLLLPAGCYVNYDLQAINFMAKLTETRADAQVDLYLSLRETMGRRPTLSEFHGAGGNLKTIRQEADHWLGFVNDQDDLTTTERQCVENHGAFFNELEMTSLTKSFKMILIEALLEMDGFRRPVRTEALSLQSYEILRRRRALLVDLPDDYQQHETLSGNMPTRWHRYWQKNPINAWTGGNLNSRQGCFRIEDDRFIFQQQIRSDLLETFEILVQEIVDYRFLQYEARLDNRKDIEVKVPLQMVGVDIPYFTDLRIACGHFRTSAHEVEPILEYRCLPASYGSLEPGRHFIARARGNSMDGGKQPIRDGDYLLLEALTSNRRSDIVDRIVAIEIHGERDQYLLRLMTKLEDGRYKLVAQNAEYKSLTLNEDMFIFAKLTAIINPSDLFFRSTHLRVADEGEAYHSE